MRVNGYGNEMKIWISGMEDMKMRVSGYGNEMKTLIIDMRMK